MMLLIHVHELALFSFPRVGVPELLLVFELKFWQGTQEAGDMKVAQAARCLL